MLQRLEKTVLAVNTDREMRRIYDKQLPEGQLDIPPYDGTGATAVKLSATIFARNWRRSWLFRFDSPKAQAFRESLVVPTVDITTFTVKELAAYAANLGIDVPNRITKTELIALIEAAVSAPVADETDPIDNSVDSEDGDAGQEETSDETD